MGLDYAWVHLSYTIPPALILSALYRYFWTRRDVYKLAFLTAIAVCATIPWDSYLIRRQIWTYPAQGILGPTLFAIPAEEIFFFVIQTYITTVLYLIASKPTFHVAYLDRPHQGAGADPRGVRRHDRVAPHLYGWTGRVVIGSALLWALAMLSAGGRTTYLALIVAWAGSFLLLLWSVTAPFILYLPWTNTVVPIVVPTVYLWIVDTVSMKRGTWVIEAGTKLGWHLWPGLDVEEALFFLLTNTLIVFGLVAFDKALAILDAFPNHFPVVPPTPSVAMLIRALVWNPTGTEALRVHAFQRGLERLRTKSKSFYLASACFQGRLRIDLMSLYSFCRVADDLVDEAMTTEEAAAQVALLRQFLALAYGNGGQAMTVDEYVRENFAADIQYALLQLPTEHLSRQPLEDLLEGFEMDLTFQAKGGPWVRREPFPIATHDDLDVYASRVAGTVAELCLELILLHAGGSMSAAARRSLIAAGQRMGIALQHVNIARDITLDALMGRVYIPTEWLTPVGLMPIDILDWPDSRKVEPLRLRLIDEADRMYDEARPALDRLPVEARAPTRVAIESYMEIGRVLRDGTFTWRGVRRAVPTWRRLLVAFRALSQG
ncbi:MAG: hypothetical protein M1838_004569 [Thelocarpon superellum]|nr:MAG: hypothetical protein M1838_004569 [Thelocarpon superellum]